MRRRTRMLLLFLTCCLLLSAAPALAEDVCVVKDASAASHVTTGCSYLRVQYPLPGETNVTLTVCDAWGEIIYQRSYGCCSGTFRSSDIHLPVDGVSSDYTVILDTDFGTSRFTVTREQPMLTDTAVYAGGLTLEVIHEIVMLVYQYFSTAIFHWNYILDLAIRAVMLTLLCILLYSPMRRIYIGKANASKSKARRFREVKHF